MTSDVNNKLTQPEFTPPLVNGSASDTTSSLHERFRVAIRDALSNGGGSAEAADACMAVIAEYNAALFGAGMNDPTGSTHATLRAWGCVHG